MSDPKADQLAKDLVDEFERLTQEYYYFKHEIEDQPKALKMGVKIYDVAKELDAIPPGRRSDLSILLDNPAPFTRLIAAIYLANTMPERAIPVLREVHALRDGISSFDAMTALFAYEHGGIEV